MLQTHSILDNVLVSSQLLFLLYFLFLPNFTQLSEEMALFAAILLFVVTKPTLTLEGNNPGAVPDDEKSKWHCKEYVTRADCVADVNPKQSFVLDDQLPCHSTKTMIGNLTMKSYDSYDNGVGYYMSMYSNSYCIDSKNANGTIQLFNDCACDAGWITNKGDPCDHIGRIGCVADGLKKFDNKPQNHKPQGRSQKS